MAEIDQGRVEQLITAGAAAVAGALTGVAFVGLGQEEEEESAQVLTLLSIDLADRVPSSYGAAVGVDLPHVQDVAVKLGLRTDEAAAGAALYRHGSLVSSVVQGMRPRAFTGGGHTVTLGRARQEMVPAPDDQVGVRVTVITLTGMVERGAGTSVGF